MVRSTRLAARALCALVGGCVVSAALGAGAALSAQPAVLARSGDAVKLEWSGVEGAGPYDVIMVQAVPDEGSGAAAAVTFGYVNASSAATWSSGGGAVQVPLSNLRSYSYVFTYARAVGGTALATSAPVRFAEPNEPTQVHLSLADKGGSDMRVMWTSRDEGASPTVQWGASASSLSSSARASSATYNSSSFCGSPATDSGNWLVPGYMHDAVMSPLQPGSTVWYRVGDAQSGVWSTPASFTAPPVAGAAVQLLVYGDMGTVLPYETEEEQQPPSAVTSARVLADVTAAGSLPSAVVHIGDLSYARGFGKFWESFMALIQPVAARVPYHVSIGNHEYDYPGQPWRPSWTGFGIDSGGECGVPTFLRFNMPNQMAASSLHARRASGGGRQATLRGAESPAAWHPGVQERNVAYSFDFGAVHFAAFSTEHDFTPGSEQSRFLAADLAAVNRSATPWVVVGGHRPMYSSSEGSALTAEQAAASPGYTEHLRASVEPLLREYGVDVAFWGHVHAYERTCGLVANFSCAARDEDGTVHVVVGNAGNVFNPDWQAYLPQTLPSAHMSSGHHWQPPWSLFRSMNFGYARVRANTTSLTMQFVGNARGQVHDELVLTKS